jgi:hypothetical protein
MLAYTCLIISIRIISRGIAECTPKGDIGYLLYRDLPPFAVPFVDHHDQVLKLVRRPQRADETAANGQLA